MNIEFSEHAKGQLERRGIAQEMVIKVIQNPQQSISSFRERKLLRAVIGGKLLEVVTRKEGLKIVVITAYFLEE